MKFKVGDKVRIKDVIDRYAIYNGKIGKVNSVGTFGDYDYNVTIDGDDYLAFRESELELVTDPSIDERVAKLEKIVADLTAKEDAEPEKTKAKDVKVGKFARNSHQHPGYFVKIANNAWVTVSPDKYSSRSDSIVVLRDSAMDEFGFEVLNEGI